MKSVQKRVEGVIKKEGRAWTTCQNPREKINNPDSIPPMETHGVGIFVYGFVQVGVAIWQSPKLKNQKYPRVDDRREGGLEVP